MTDREPDTSMLRYQKFALGMFGIVMLSIGGVMYAWAPMANVFISAMLIRVGMLLCVVWLAFDQLQQLSKYFSAIVLTVGLGVLVLIAARPNISKVVLVMFGVLGAFSLAAKFLRTKR